MLWKRSSLKDALQKYIFSKVGTFLKVGLTFKRLYRIKQVCFANKKSYGYNKKFIYTIRKNTFLEDAFLQKIISSMTFLESRYFPQKTV
jgi:hypothetical protein